MSDRTNTMAAEIAAAAARTHETRAYAAASANSRLAPATIRRREPGFKKTSSARSSESALGAVLWEFAGRFRFLTAGS